jgi:hypothetical protein
MIGFLSAIALLGGSPSPCEASLPRGPEVPAPIVLSTDCGWFRLETEGAVSRLPSDWLAKQNAAWRQRHGPRLTVRRSRDGRYFVVRSGRVIWRSAGRYVNEAGNFAFGSHAFAFDSYGRRGVFVTDLRGPERLVLHGRAVHPLHFTDQGELVATGPRMIIVVSPDGTVTRRYPYRRSTSYSFDEETETLFFVTPGGMLSAAQGSAVRRIRKISVRGSISVLGRRLLVFTGRRHVAVLLRDGSLVARTRWSGAKRELDAGVATSDDGKTFAFRVSKARPGMRRSTATVYVLRAGENRGRAIHRHRLDQSGCGSGAGLDWDGSSVLYVSRDRTGLAEAAVLAPDGSRIALAPLLRALPRISPHTPGNAFWARGFS